MLNGGAVTAGPQLYISLDAIRHNYHTVLAHLKKTAAMSAVVKSDAYGLGMKKLAPLFYDLGCRRFFTARINEAEQLRAILPQNDYEIFILDGIYSPQDAQRCCKNSFIPIINTVDQAKLCKNMPAGLHIDTGMNRLGVKAQELAHLDITQLNLKMIMTHPSCADEPQRTETQDQFIEFQRLTGNSLGADLSFCNSAALFSNTDYHMDIVRPGISLYGGESLPHAQTGIIDTVELYAPILQIKAVSKGETVGYGASYQAPTDRKIAVIGIGYADGIPRNIGNNTGTVYIKGYPCPIVGRISMELTTVDVTDIHQMITPDDRVEIIGKHQPLDDFSKKAGIIGYESLTRLGKSIEKCYSN